jgi:hypothetical protein
VGFSVPPEYSHDDLQSEDGCAVSGSTKYQDMQPYLVFN